MSGQEEKSTRQLLQDFAAIMRELRHRRVVRSSNNPVADFAETLVCEALGLHKAQASTKGYDAMDDEGKRYEIKGRRLTAEGPSRQMGMIRDLNGGHFEFCAVVLFAEDFAIFRAVVLPAELVKKTARYVKRVNAWIFHANDSLLNQPGVHDITELVRRVPSYADSPCEVALST